MDVAPALGRRPAPLKIQRSTRQPPDDDESDARRADAPAAGTDRAVVVHRGPETSQLADALHARGFTHRGEVFLPQHHGPLSSEPARSILAHELVHVEQQRRLGTSLPPEESVAGQHLEREARQAERAPLVMRTTRPNQAASTAPRSASGSAQLLDEEATREETAAVVEMPGPQRAEEGSLAEVDTSPRALPAGSVGDGQQRERELEILAGRLYERIRLRLRRELLVDREQAGLMSNVH